jgi:CheY-like chemotaxis protein
MTRNVIAVVDDLFFASKIRGTAEQLGVKVTFGRTVAALTETSAREQPALIICDLHSQRIDPVELAKELKSRAITRDIPLLGFFSHLQTDLQRAAKEAGFDHVIPRSVFAKDLAGLLAGIE